MSYMRGIPYIYPTTEDTLFIGSGASSVEITQDQAEELAAMIWFRITPERRREVLERTYENHGGNIGCDGVALELGFPTGTDMLRAVVQQAREDRGEV